MTPDVKDWMKGLVTEIVNAPSCCAELKPVAEEWLKKCDTDELMDVTKKLLDELKLDVNTIDQTIAFTESDAAKDMFGAEKAAEMKNAKVFNMIVLGGLLKVCPIVPDSALEKALYKTPPERHHDLIPLNMKAVEEGRHIIA